MSVERRKSSVGQTIHTPHCVAHHTSTFVTHKEPDGMIRDTHGSNANMHGSSSNQEIDSMQDDAN